MRFGFLNLILCFSLSAWAQIDGSSLQESSIDVESCKGIIKLINPMFDFRVVTCVGENIDCECLKNGLYPNYQSDGQQALANLRRNGYQLLVQNWANEFATYIAHSPQGERLPASCTTDSFRERLQQARRASTCAGDAAQFDTALQAVFGADRRGTATERTIRLVNRAVDNERYYAEAGLMDCMEPSQKTALSFIYSTGEGYPNLAQLHEGLGAMAMPLLNNDLSTIRRTVIAPGDDNPLGALFRVFPKLRTLLAEKMSGDAGAITPILSALQSYVSSLQGVTKEDLESANGQTRANALQRLSRAAESVHAFIDQNVSRTSDVLTGRCNNLSEQLNSMACSHESFTALPAHSLALDGVDEDSFLEEAARLNPSGGISREQVATCNADRNLQTAHANFGTCLNYNFARCISNESHQRASLGALQTSSRASVESAFSWRESARQIAANRQRREQEVGMIKNICGNFNSYANRECAALKTDAEAYRSCQLNLRPDDAGYQRFLTDNNISNDIVTNLASNRWDTESGVFQPRSSVAKGFGSDSRKSNAFYAADGSDTMPTASTAASTVKVAAPTATTFATSAPTAAAAPEATKVETTIARAPASSPTVSPIDQLDQQMEEARARMASLQNQLSASEQRTRESLQSEIDRLRQRISDDEAQKREMAAAPPAAADTAPRAARPVADADTSAQERHSTARRADAPVAAAETFRAAASTTAASSGGAAATGGPDGPRGSGNSVDSTYSANGVPTGIARAILTLDRNARGEPILRVMGTEYRPEDINQLVIREGQTIDDSSILGQLMQMQDTLRFDDNQRAVVEVFDQNTRTARLVYVQRQGRALSLIPLPQRNLDEQVGRIRARLDTLRNSLQRSRQL